MDGVGTMAIAHSGPVNAVCAYCETSWQISPETVKTPEILLLESMATNYFIRRVLGIELTEDQENTTGLGEMVKTIILCTYCVADFLRMEAKLLQTQLNYLSKLSGNRDFGEILADPWLDLKRVAYAKLKFQEASMQEKLQLIESYNLPSRPGTTGAGSSANDNVDEVELDTTTAHTRPPSTSTSVLTSANVTKLPGMEIEETNDDPPERQLNQNASDTGTSEGETSDAGSSRNKLQSNSNIQVSALNQTEIESNQDRQKVPSTTLPKTAYHMSPVVCLKDISRLEASPSPSGKFPIPPGNRKDGKNQGTGIEKAVVRELSLGRKGDVDDVGDEILDKEKESHENVDENESLDESHNFGETENPRVTTTDGEMLPDAEDAEDNEAPISGDIESASYQNIEEESVSSIKKSKKMGTGKQSHTKKRRASTNQLVDNPKEKRSRPSVPASFSSKSIKNSPVHSPTLESPKVQVPKRAGKKSTPLPSEKHRISGVDTLLQKSSRVEQTSVLTTKKVSDSKSKDPVNDLLQKYGKVVENNPSSLTAAKKSRDKKMIRIGNRYLPAGSSSSDDDDDESDPDVRISNLEGGSDSDSD